MFPYKFFILNVLFGVPLLVFGNVTLPRSHSAKDDEKFTDLAKKLNNTLRTSRAIAGISRQSSNCGGYVELSGTNEIIYQIPQGLQEVSCIWIVWAKNGMPIDASNVYNEMAQFDQNFKLVIAHNYTKEHGFYSAFNALGTTTKVKTSDPVMNFVWIHFRGKPSKEQQGFHIKLTDSGSTTTVGYRPIVKFIQFDRNRGTFRYPPNGKSFYDNNERTFMIGHVPEGKSLRLSVLPDLEKRHDVFYTSWLEGKPMNFRNYWYPESITYTEVIPGGTSYLMAFVTDSSVVKSGVQLTYEYNDNAQWK